MKNDPLAQLVIEECSRVDLKGLLGIKKGGTVHVSCPLHSDSTPSLAIYPISQYEQRDKVTWFCFSCRRGGNTINYLKTIKGMGFRESLDQLLPFTNIHQKYNNFIKNNGNTNNRNNNSR